jgi:hypothetical protein
MPEECTYFQLTVSEGEQQALLAAWQRGPSEYYRLLDWLTRTDVNFKGDRLQPLPR